MKRLSDEEILDELEIELELKSTKVLTPLEERLISRFEEINVFYETHQRVPCLNDDADIFEKLCASRLEKIKQNAEMKSVVLFLENSIS